MAFFKKKAWVPTFWILSGGNIVAAWFAALPGEAMHAATHAVLAVVFAVGADRLSRRFALQGGGESDLESRVMELEDRIAQMGSLPDASRLTELEERVDFTERVLVEVRKKAELPPRP